MKVFTTLALIAGLISLILAQVLFSTAPVGGRENFYKERAKEALIHARRAEREAEVYYYKYIGKDKTGEPVTDSEWRQYHADLKRNWQSSIELARMADVRAFAAEENARELRLRRIEHFQICLRVGIFGLIVAVCGMIWLVLSRFSERLNQICGSER